MSRCFRTSECDQRATWVRRLHDVLADVTVGAVFGEELRLTTDGASAAVAAVRSVALNVRSTLRCGRSSSVRLDQRLAVESVGARLPQSARSGHTNTASSLEAETPYG